MALTLDEKGIPDTVEGRVDIAQRIGAGGRTLWLRSTDLFFDALTLTVATDTSGPSLTLQTLRELHRRGYRTVLGVSNVSFGLPNRPTLTAAFLSMALEAGLDAAILNPLDSAVSGAFWGEPRALIGCNRGLEEYLQAMQRLPAPAPASAAPARVSAPAGKAEPEGGDALYRAIRDGLSGDAKLAAQALLDGGSEPLSLIEGSVMPALTEVGAR